MIKIEKDIPMPEDRGVGKPPKYPWTTMEVGDSFFVPDINATKFNRAGSMSLRYSPKKFLSRTVNQGTRTWRIK